MEVRIEIETEDDLHFTKVADRLGRVEQFLRESVTVPLVQVGSTFHESTSREIGKLNEFIMRMEITLRRHRLNGEDHIRVLDFLARFKRAFSIPEMLKA